jgi:orotidine-5'-phosphate decarboxylase
MIIDPGNRLIAALDVEDLDAALVLAERLDRAASWVKVGLELFSAAGPDAVRALVERGYQVMLDLKLHDIPETVARATRQAARLGAGLVTVHSAGGEAMMRAAVAAAGDSLGVLAVTVLTSLDESDLAAVGVAGTVVDVVAQRARLALSAGAAGVVASAHEAARIRALAASDFLVVTPGVRPAGAALGDQKRVMTPARARAAGADLIVVGRPIRDAADPASVARAIVAEFHE